jgi:hypothetical protein
MSTNVKTNYTPPEEQSVEPTSPTKPDKKRVIKNQLKLLLMLAAIYSLIINQAQKKIPGAVKQSSGKSKNEMTLKKPTNDELANSASFLLFKE